ncbi:hypothetical protein NBRC111894_615 [Sporolactobacillus inulinus]|uniref:Uncharacterized protein n=1 Tax=Sporolactobacillus inulinus TaxID=2078 RepID=A0A4Y1Z821_9BACL|nr:hypothetical protein NBRC111894_615 [Sporolactobacillus inulinus]
MGNGFLYPLLGFAHLSCGDPSLKTKKLCSREMHRDDDSEDRRLSLFAGRF